MAIDGVERDLALIVAIGTRACALPLGHVVETMRPLAIENVAGSPTFIVGVSVIRGVPVPIVDLSALLVDGKHRDTYGRFVTLKVGERTIAVGVDDVLGLRRLDSAQLETLPPILRDVRADYVASIGRLDEQLLVVLRATRIVPDDCWSRLSAAAEPTQ